MNNSNKKDSFLLQAGILAAAGMISRIIGLLYRSPLQGIIGDLGMGYYGSAYYYYTIILLISSYSIPSAISKVIAQKLAVEEYRNAHRTFICALWYVLAVGAVASIFLFFCAGWFVAKEVVPVLRCFAPTIFIYGMLGVLRGYFQAHKSMVETSLSQIIEQIANAVVSVGAAFLLTGFVSSTAWQLTKSTGQVEKAIWGALGSALGTGSGVVVALVFMYFVYKKREKEILERVKSDSHSAVDSYGHILGMITRIVTPFILSTAVYNLSGVMNDQVFNKWIPAMQGMTDTVERYASWGIYSGTVLTISNIPIAFASAMAAAMIPSIAHLMARADLEGAKQKVYLATKTTMILSIPSAVGIFVLARPLICLLFPATSEASSLMGAKLLMTMAPSVVFYALSTLNSSILQGIGKVNTPIYHAAFSIVVQTAIALVLAGFTPLGLYGIGIAATVYSLMMCILNQYAVAKALSYKQEVRTTFFAPVLASVIMGFVCYGIYLLIRGITASPRLAVLLSVMVGALIYFISLIMCKGVKEEELKAFPKGNTLYRIAHKCKLI